MKSSIPLMKNSRRAHFPLITLIVILHITFTLGCASSPDVKVASSQMSQALDEYEHNLLSFRDAWMAEIDKTRVELGNALVARAVKYRIEQLSQESNGFSNATWQKEFKKRGMIALSEEIESTQEAARRYVRRLLDTNLEDKSVSDVLSELNQENKSALLALADMLESNKPAKARRVREYANSLDMRNEIIEDSMVRSYAAQILEWGALKKEIPENLGNLQQVVAALKTTHTTVDNWIQTDVKVSGQQIAEMVETHAKFLGLEGQGGNP